MSPGESQDLALDTICGGAAMEQFADALEEISQNIQDPNTDPKKVRSITITVTFKPNESREFSQTHVSVTKKPAPSKAVGEITWFGHNRRTGKYVATRRDPQQLEIGEEPKEAEVLPIAKHQKQGS